MAQTDMSRQLAQAPVPRLLLRLSLPAIAAQLVNALYSIVDRVFIGNMPGVGADALTGLGFTMPVIMIISAFSMLIGMGGSPLLSIRLGEGDKAAAARLQGCSFTLLLAIGTALTGLFWFLRVPILTLFGAEANTLPYAADYLGVYVLGSVFVMISLGMNAFLNAQGRTGVGTVTVVLGAAVNLILDPIFIYVLDLGIAGAALATLISQALSALWVLWFLFFSKRLMVRLRPNHLRVSWTTTVEICKLGVSTFIFEINESVVQIVINLLLRRWGGSTAVSDLYIGSMTIINSLLAVFFMPLKGIVRGAQPIIGYCCGARDYPRLRETVRWARVFSITCATLMWACFECFPGPLCAVFNDDPALTDLSARLTRLFFCTIFLLGLQMVNQHSFIAMGNAKLSFLFGILRKILLLLPLAFLLPLFLGVDGVILAEPVANVFTVIITQIVFTRYLEQLRRDFTAPHPGETASPRT